MARNHEEPAPPGSTLRLDRRVGEADEATFRHPRYEAVSLLGRGGMGTVFSGFDRELEREVAIKWIGRSAAPADLLERFVREARVTSQLDHPNIVPVHDAGESEGGGLFYTMKRVRGRSLHDVAREPAADRRPLLRAYLKVCEAVAFAHSRGVLHRDLKPENVMIGEFGEVLVMDWGLARTAAGEVRHDAPADHALEAGIASGRTMAGTILGTPAYMSPEQARGEVDRLDERSDVYGLGAILFEILAGRAPFEGDSTRVLGQVQKGRSPLARRSGRGSLPRELEAVVAKAMDPDPRRRFASAAELSSEIEAFLEGRPLRSARYGPLALLGKWVGRHRSVTAVAGVAAAVVAVLGGLSVHRILEERRAALESAGEALREKERAEAHALALVRLDRARQELERALVLRRGGRGHRERAVRGLDLALTEARRALEIAPDMAAAHDVLGEIHLARREPERAVEAWRRALALEPGFAHQRLETARLEMERLLDDQFLKMARGSSAEGMKEEHTELEYRLSALLEAFDGKEREYRLEPIRAALLFLRGDHDEVRRYCGEALARVDDRPTRADLLAYLGSSLGMGRVEEIDADRIARGFEALDEALRLAPDHVMGRVFRGWFRVTYGKDLAGCIEDFEVVLGEDEMGPMFLNAGLQWIREGRFEAARDILTRARKKLPRNAQVHRALGAALERTGDAAGAIESMRAAVDLAPRSLEFRQLLAGLLDREGHREEAAAEYRDLLRSAPADWPARQEVADRLRALEGR